MKPTYKPEEIVGSRSRIAVLRVLWWAKHPMNASQIAQRASLTRPAVATVLKELGDAGVVLSSSAGQANIHSLNRSNYYVAWWVAPLFEAEIELPQHLGDELEDTFESNALAGVLFGSYARGDQTPESDVDLALVASDQDTKAALDEQLLEYQDEFHKRWGAPLSAVTYTAHEAGALWRTAPAFFDSLKTDGVVLFGKGPWEWVEDE